MFEDDTKVFHISEEHDSDEDDEVKKEKEKELELFASHSLRNDRAPPNSESAKSPMDRNTNDIRPSHYL